MFAVCWLLSAFWFGRGNLDKGPAKGPIDIGAGFKLPVYVTGPVGHGWWAMVMLMLVAGSLYFAYLFSYLYIWTVSPGVWPSDAANLPSLQWPAVIALLFIAGAAFFAVAKGTLPEPGEKNLLTPLLILLGALLSVFAVYLEIWCQWQTGLSPAKSSYGSASVYGRRFRRAVGFCGADDVAVRYRAAFYRQARPGTLCQPGKHQFAGLLHRSSSAYRSFANSRLPENDLIMTTSKQVFSEKFIGIALLSLAGPFIWVLHFAVVYGVQHIVCATLKNNADFWVHTCHYCYNRCGAAGVIGINHQARYYATSV